MKVHTDEHQIAWHFLEVTRCRWKKGQIEKLHKSTGGPSINCPICVVLDGIY